MHTASKVVIGLGVLVLIIGIILFATTGDDFEDDIEEGIIYEGADGKIEIDNVAPNNGSQYIVHLVNVKFVGGSTGGYNDAHGNETWNLTNDDCNLVKSFSLKNDDTEMFYPQCNYIQDTTVDKYIVIGRLCNDVIYNEFGWEVGHEGEGCRAGTYTWDTNGEKIMVYDINALFGAFFSAILQGLGSFGACCCGSIILIIGIIMAATMEDNNKNPYNQQQSTYTPPDNGNTPESASGWDQQEDYIHRENKNEEIPEKSDMAIPESEDEKRSGEYKIPPSE